MNSVFVLSSTKKPLMPCRPARARQLLTAGRAAVYRQHPFTIILKDRDDGDTQPVEVKVDPGSKTTGIALVGHFEQQGAVMLFGANLNHRGQAIKNNLESRRSLRRGRRGRKTRYREARFLNRTRLSGWLPPSIESRVVNTESIIRKLAARCPITEAAVELVKFDLQAMVNPEISGVEYQQGELAGYEVRQYLVESPAKTMNVIIPDSVPRFLALRFMAVRLNQPARKGKTLPVNPPSGGVIGTGECSISLPLCESSLNSTAPRQRAVGRPRTDPQGFENHGITGRDGLYGRKPRARKRTAKANPTPAGGASQTPGTDFQEPLDGLLREFRASPDGLARNQALRNPSSQRGRSSSMTHFPAAA